ncbi:MAG: hypothetical protein R6X33_15405 [Candidatus Brocadiia bacterium]
MTEEADRQQPSFERVDFEFGEGSFPATATIAFEAVYGPSAPPARHVTVQAGRLGTWVIEFIPAEDLPAGARIGFRKVENDFKFAWRFQDYWPDARDYVTVEDAAGRPLPFECDRALKSKVPAVVTLPRPLPAGEPIVVRIGDRRRGGPGSVTRDAVYGCARVACGVRLEGDDTFRRVPGATVEISIVPQPSVAHCHVFSPSQAGPDEEFTTAVLPLDINGNGVPPPEGLGIECGGREAEAAETGSGSLCVRCTAPSEGVAHVEIRDGAHGLTARSNPILVAPGSDLKTYWGEFHAHGYDAVEINVLNDDTHPDKAYRYGRDATRLDFCGMGSHVFRHAPDAVHEWWELYREAAREHDEEGRYVTFLGCEWRDAEPEGGDRNLIWRDLDAPAPDPTWKIGEVYDRFRSRPAMVTPHVGGTPATPGPHDGEVERLCEMVSGHGQFEWFAQAYLAKGYRVGLIGGSDGHHARPGHPRLVSTFGGGRWASVLRMRDSGWAGGPLLGVLAERLERESLWEAFQARRTYASTGARALLDFRVNGLPMGSELKTDGDVELSVNVHGTAPVRRVDLIRGSHRLQRWEGDSERFSATLTDTPPDGETYYYVRVEQEDGEMLWSSPVWLESRSGRPADDLPAWNEPEDIDLDEVGDEEAARHLDDLLHYLRREENPDAFSRITPYRMVDSPRGEYAVFLGYLRDRRVRIHWFHEFEHPRIRLETGWVQYGRERIWGADWSLPMFPNQDTM